MRFFGRLSLALVLAPLLAFAQLGELDPDTAQTKPSKPAAKPKAGALNDLDPDVAPRKKPPAKPEPAPNEDDESADEAEPPAGRQPIDVKPGEKPTIEPEASEPKTGKLPAPGAEVAKPSATDQPPAAVAAPSPAKKPGEKAKDELPPMFGPAAVPPIVVKKLSDADFDAVWEKWRAADASNDGKAEVLARAELLQLKESSGAFSLEPFALGLLRAAAAKEQAGSSSTAIEMALNAVELAPKSPAVRLGLVSAYFHADPSEIGRLVSSMHDALSLLFTDVRTSRGALGDAGVTVLLALCFTAIAVTLMLFVRRARYFFYDFHFLFPRAAARWQSAAVAVLLLGLPLMFGVGLAPALLVLFAAATLYLSNRERLVAAALIGCLGAVPLVGEQLVARTAFAGTPAEATFVLDQGGPNLEPVAQAVLKRAAEDKATFAELSALGHYELRRGRFDLAIPRLKAALLKVPDEPRASNNLGVAMMLNGDLENPKALFEASARGDATLAAPWFNLSRLHQRRTLMLGAEKGAAEVDAANVAKGEALRRDPSLESKKDPPNDKPLANAYLVTLPLSDVQLAQVAESAEAQERVKSQLMFMLVGDVSEPVGFIYPAVLALLLVGLGTLSTTLGAARECARCGRPVSRRGDPEVVRGSNTCTQCVNVFNRKGVVPPSEKVRKQVEVARYQERMDRLSFAFGVICSGLGHIFKGLPVRGTLYAFVFLVAIVALVLRNGVLRVPYEGAPLWLKLSPAVLSLVLVYGVSLKTLLKKKTE